MKHRTDPYAALRHRDYVLFLAGHILTILGMQMQSVAVGWEIYDRTGSPWALGLTGLAQFFPVIACAIPVGHLADTYNRRMLLLLGQLFMAVASVGLALISFNEGPVSLMYACLVFTGISTSFSITVRSSILSTLVPRDLLPNAITWNSTGRQLATIIGPALGGLLIAWTGAPMWAYLGDALMALTFVVLILLMRVREPVRKAEAATLRSLLAGMRFIWRRKLLLSTMTLDTLAVFFGGVTALLPIFAEDILHVGPAGLGWLRAAPSAGAMAMAFALAHLPLLKRAGPTLLWSVAGFGISIVLFGMSTDIRFSLFFLACVGAFDTVSVVVRHSLLQLLTPDTMRGRVAAATSVFFGSSGEIGAFESGVAAALLGPVTAVIFGGLASVTSVVFVMFKWPQVAKLRSLQDVKVEDDEPNPITG